jgi:hypothetical protein
MVGVQKSLVSLLIILALAASAFAACEFTPAAKNTAAFLAEVPALNMQLSTCPVPLSGGAKALFGSNNNVQLTITRTDGTTSAVLFTISGAQLTAVSSGAGTHGYEVLITECELDTILASDTKAGATAYLYSQGKAKVIAKGFWNRLKLGTAKVFGSGAIKKSATAVTVSCLKENGAICQHGGECTSGNCVGEGQGPSWTYRCSCDPMTYKTACPTKPTPQVDASGKRPAGELCDHGGQCKTGNCVGVGQGPPWTYRCSCDTSRFTTGC